MISKLYKRNIICRCTGIEIKNRVENRFKQAALDVLNVSYFCLGWGIIVFDQSQR